MMKQNMKRCLLVILLLSIVFVITGCKKTYDKLDHVYHNGIFAVQEREYYIYVYRPNCEVCSSLEELVYNYAKKAKRDNDLPNLYVLNKGDTINNAGIYHGNGVGNDFIGATTYQEIKTSTSPVLFKIKNGRVVSLYQEDYDIKSRLTL